MKTTLVIFAICIAVTLIAGCGGGGGIGGSGASGLSGGSGSGISGLVGGSGSGSGSGGAGSSSGGGGLSGVINPEPATVALLGAGLAAFAILRRRKK